MKGVRKMDVGEIICVILYQIGLILTGYYLGCGHSIRKERNYMNHTFTGGYMKIENKNWQEVDEALKVLQKQADKIYKQYPSSYEIDIGLTTLRKLFEKYLLD